MKKSFPEFEEIFETPRRRSRRPIGRPILLAALLACAAALFIALAGAVSGAREAARRSQCVCGPSQLRLALHNYHSVYGSLPPAYTADARGRPLLSWRVLVLPFMENQALFDRFHLDEPWNGPNNIRLLGQTPSFYACPSWHDRPAGATSYVAITGPGTLFPVGGTRTFDDVKDDKNNTLLMAEVSNVNIPWTAPVDLDVRTMSYRLNDPKRPGISSKHPGGANVFFVEGSYRLLDEATTPGELKVLITIAEGENVDRDEALSRP